MDKLYTKGRISDPIDMALGFYYCIEKEVTSKKI